jgi:hypothetical protein
MSDLRKAAQQALEALEYENEFHWQHKENKYGSITDAITALRAALAQPIISPEIKGDKAEPVAYLWQHSETGRTRIIEKDQVWTASNQWKRVGPLYLHPPQRKPLTDEEIEYLAPASFTWREFARAIEKVHGIGGEE